MPSRYPSLLASWCLILTAIFAASCAEPVAENQPIKSPKNSPRPVRVRVLSYNIWALPGLSMEYARRMKQLPSALLKLDPDVVCLQEVWL